MKDLKDKVIYICVLCISIILMILNFNYKMYIWKYNFEGKVVIYIIMFILTLITILLFTYISRKRELKVEKTFLIVAISFCMLFCIAVPISKGHDETIHGLRIYEYVNGKIVSDGETASLQQGVINALSDKPEYYNLFEKDKDYSTNTEIVDSKSRIATYSPITYLPEIVGVFIGRLITDNALIQLYIARISNMILCITMIYYAIKIIPFGKNMIFLISLIPIAIEGYVTLSADGITLASSILFISFVLKLSYDTKEKISNKQFFILTLLSIIVAISKTVYLPIVLFALIIPKEKFKHNKYIQTIGMFAIAAIVDFLWYMLGTKTSIQGQSTEAIQFILMNPTKYIGKICYTLFIRYHIYIEEMFGGYLEWNENVRICVFPIILLITSVLIIKKGEKETFELKAWQKILCVIIVLSVILAIFTAMFLGWARLEKEYIEGVQGRYLLPILPIILMLFSRNFLDDNRTTKNIALLILVMQIFVITNIVMFHI